MTFRNLTNDNDWTFGSGISDYATEQREIELNIKTRVWSFLGDCFFAINEGIDYWNLLDYNRQDELENQIKSTIINTPGVQSIEEVDILLSANRKFNLSYSVKTIYSSSITGTIPLVVQ